MNFFNNNGCGGFGGMTGGCDCCNLIIWILILQCLCGNNGFNMDCCTLILLLLLCGGCGGK